MKWFIYVAVAILAFVTFLIVAAPASFVLGSVSEELNKRQSDVAISGFSGSIWNGTGNVQYMNLPPAELNWSLSALPLITGTASTDITLQADGLEAQAETRISGNGGSGENIDATVHSRYINQMTRPLGLDLTGVFTLTDGRVVSDGKWITDAAGALNWPGGLVTIQTPGETITTRLPPLDGNISMAGTDLVLNVTSEGTDMLQVKLRPNGWAEVGINGAFLETAGINPSNNSYSADSDPAILLEEKIF